MGVLKQIQDILQCENLSSIKPPSLFEVSISWLAFAISAAAAAAAFAACAASSANVGFESVLFNWSSSSSKTILRIQDFNRGRMDF